MKGKGNAHVGKMDAILTDLHLDARISTCILMNVIVPKSRVRNRIMEREREGRKTAGNSSTGDSSWKNLEYSISMINTVLRAELGKLKW